MASRYGWSLVIASNASTIAKIRAGERDLGAAQTARIARTVPALVVAGDHLAGEAAERGDRGDDALAQPRMLADLVELGG